MGKRTGFEKKFEGEELLGELLSAAGSPYGPNDVIGAFINAKNEGLSASEVIPTLFQDEPRFEDPSLAKRLFENLLGLWELLDREPAEALRQSSPRPKKAPKPQPPEPFEGEPDEAYVEAAWRYLDALESLDKKEWNRLQHRFENRQDALLGFLDEQALSDEGYACARFLLFELCSMIELGWPPGCGTAQPAETSDKSAGGLPKALVEYVEDSVFEAEQDEETPLRPQEAQRVREVVRVSLAALWSARRQ